MRSEATTTSAREGSIVPADRDAAQSTTSTSALPEAVTIQASQLLAQARTRNERGALASAESADLDVNVVYFGAGEGVAAHVNAEVDVLLAGLSGSGQVTVDGTPNQVAPGTLLLIPKGAQRAIQASEDGLGYLTCHRRRRPLQPAVRKQGSPLLRTPRAPQPERRAALPEFPLPPEALGTPQARDAFRLRVDGLVERPLSLTDADLAALPQHALDDDFTCLEGWTVPGVPWRGVRVADVLDLAGAQSDAQWLQASAGDFGLPLSLEEARQALLARGLGDQPLPPEHGGPLRLVVPGRECFTSVKWLSRLEVRATPAPNTAEQIARGRLEPPAQG